MTRGAGLGLSEQGVESTDECAVGVVLFRCPLVASIVVEREFRDTKSRLPSRHSTHIRHRSRGRCPPMVWAKSLTSVITRRPPLNRAAEPGKLAVSQPANGAGPQARSSAGPFPGISIRPSTLSVLPSNAGWWIKVLFPQDMAGRGDLREPAAHV